MDQRTFTRVTKEVFTQYGFRKEGRRTYVLPLEEIDIAVEYASWRGIKEFHYLFSIRKRHNENLSIEERTDVGVWLKMEHSEALEGYHRHEILVEEWTEEEWRELLSRMLHKYFDPFKEDAFAYIRKNAKTLALTRWCREYLGIPD